MASSEVERWTAARACGRARAPALFRGQFLQILPYFLQRELMLLPHGAMLQRHSLRVCCSLSGPVLRLCRSKKFQELLCLPPSPCLMVLLFFSDSWSISAQLEIPYVCPNGLVRVLSPPPFLTPKEVRLPLLSLPSPEHLGHMGKPAALTSSTYPLV